MSLPEKVVQISKLNLEGIDSLYSEGFTAIFGIIRGACDLSTALKNGPSNVARTTENIVRLLKF